MTMRDPIQIENLSSHSFFDVSFTLSETINLETDIGKKCKNYPTENVASFKECDLDFVYNEMKNKYNISVKTNSVR